MRFINILEQRIICSRARGRFLSMTLIANTLICCKRYTSHYLGHIMSQVEEQIEIHSLN